MSCEGRDSLPHPPEFFGVGVEVRLLPLLPACRSAARAARSSSDISRGSIFSIAARVWAISSEFIKPLPPYKVRCVPARDAAVQHPRLWRVQIESGQNVETSLTANRPRSLNHMATGSGKTYTAVSSCYRLIRFAGAANIAVSCLQARAAQRRILLRPPESTPDGQTDRGASLPVRLRSLMFRLAGPALACGLLCAPSAVHADCASHLPDLSRFTLPFGQPRSHASPAHRTPSAPDGNDPKPCSGPNCSSHRGPGPLPTAPPPEPPTHGEEWGCLLTLTPRPGPTSGVRRLDMATGRPVRRGASVFHPPRLSSISNPL